MVTVPCICSLCPDGWPQVGASRAEDGQSASCTLPSATAGLRSTTFAWVCSVVDSCGGLICPRFVYVAHIRYTVQTAKQISPIDIFDPDDEESSKFKITLVNTAVYLLSISMQATTIFTNYHGAPFMKGIFENVGLKRCLFFLWGMAAVATAGVSPGFNDFLELAPCETSFRITLMAVMTGDLAAVLAVDAVCNKIFPLDASNHMQLLQKHEAR